MAFVLYKIKNKVYLNKLYSLHEIKEYIGGGGEFVTPRRICGVLNMFNYARGWYRSFKLCFEIRQVVLCTE
jgi:hypothetical protein